MSEQRPTAADDARPSTTQPWAGFQREDDGSLSLSAAVFQALGAASVCWEHMEGTGVFDSTRARAIGDALLEEIRAELHWTPVPAAERPHFQPPPDQPVRVTYADGLRSQPTTVETRPRQAAGFTRRTA